MLVVLCHMFGCVSDESYIILLSVTDIVTGVFVFISIHRETTNHHRINDLAGLSDFLEVVGVIVDFDLQILGNDIF
jgi:hypothetical protein